MLCIYSIPLSDDELDIVLLGLGDARIRTHLDTCELCALRLEEARKVEYMLMNRLYRWNCPTPHELGDYYLDTMDQSEKEATAEHLKNCLRCQADLKELQTFLEGDSFQPIDMSVVRTKKAPPRPRLGELVARLLPRPLTSAYRGAESGPHIAEADGMTLFLEVHPGRAGSALAGQIATDNLERWAGSLVVMQQAGALQVIALLDELGGFLCEPLTNGPIDIRIASPDGQTIVLEGLELPT